MHTFRKVCMKLLSNNIMIDFEPTPSPKRKLNVVYIIDTSRSMEGLKIECVNKIMSDIIALFADINNSNQDNVEIVVSCLSFNTKPEWMYDTPVSANNFKWLPLSTCGVTNLGQACKTLEKSLHNSTENECGIMNSLTGFKSPCIILLSDGEPTDDWEYEFQKLKQNPWFKAASKIAIAIGDDADLNTLSEFVGNSELVLGAKEIDHLKEMVSFASRSAIARSSALSDWDLEIWK